MSFAVILICAVLGLFVGSIVWTIARNQASRRFLLTGPRCEDTQGVSFSSAAKTKATRDSSVESPEGAACGQPLPVLAWLPLYGFGTALRCAHCRHRQPTWRIYVEILTALFFALAAWRIEDGVDLTAALVFSVPLLVVLLVDTWTRLIYTNVIYAGIALGLIFAIVDGGARALGSSALAMVAAFLVFMLFFVLARVLYRSVAVVPFGRGDIYLAVMIGAMVRLDDIVRALFLGVVLAAVGGAVLIFSKQLTRRQAMPYGPYLCLGALIALIW